MKSAAAKRTLTLDAFPARLRVDQAATYLNCSSTHVSDLIRAGALEAVNLAGPKAKRAYYMIAREAILAFEQKGKA